MLSHPRYSRDLPRGRFTNSSHRCIRWINTVAKAVCERIPDELFSWKVLIVRPLLQCDGTAICSVLKLINNKREKERCRLRIYWFGEAWSWFKIILEEHNYITIYNYIETLVSIRYIFIISDRLSRFLFDNNLAKM